jgi:hypothetical protein
VALSLNAAETDIDPPSRGTGQRQHEQDGLAGSFVRGIGAP